MIKVRCPFCNYEMPLYFDEKTDCKGLKVKCKGRNCRKEFEVKIKENKQIK